MKTIARCVPAAVIGASALLLMFDWGLASVLGGCGSTDRAVPGQGPAHDEPHQLSGQQDEQENSMDEIARLRQEASNPKHADSIRRQTLARLAPVFAGQISVSAKQQDIPRHIARMSSLMAAWNPIGCSAHDLKSLAGEPSQQAGERLEYRFDTGWGGIVWRFQVLHDRVVSVEFQGLD